MTFIRTSKILFKPNGPNGINQGKLNELASFIDLCNVALNFYLVNFIECYELDKLFAIKNGTKNANRFTNKAIFSNKPCSKLTILNNIFYELSQKDTDDEKEIKYCFKIKLKFYPSGIGDGTDLRRIQVVEKKLEFNKQSPLSARTLKSVENQAFAIIKSWVKQILKSYLLKIKHLQLLNLG